MKEGRNDCYIKVIVAVCSSSSLKRSQRSKDSHAYRVRARLEEDLELRVSLGVANEHTVQHHHDTLKRDKGDHKVGKGAHCRHKEFENAHPTHSVGAGGTLLSDVLECSGASNSKCVGEFKMKR